MKNLNDMPVREFAETLANGCDSYDRLQVYDYLQIHTDGFEISKTHALLLEVNDVIMKCIRQNAEIQDNTLLWYAFNTLYAAVSPEQELQSGSTEYSSYILQAFYNNILLIDKFFERIESMPGERKTTPIAIEIDALCSLGKLNTGKLKTFCKELNGELGKRGILPIGYTGFSGALGTHKTDLRLEASKQYYKRFLENRSE